MPRPATRPAPLVPPKARRRLRIPRVVVPPRSATGALVGLALWTGFILLGVPMLVHRDGYAGLAVAAALGALLAWALPRHRAIRALWILAWAVVALEAVMLVVIVLTPLAGALVARDIRRDAYDPHRPFDAVAVLSARLSADGHLETEGMDRLLAGASLIAQTGTRTLILSRIDHWYGMHRVTSDADQRRVIALLGDRAPRVIVVDDVASTHDEAVRMSEVARHESFHNIALVTSPDHTARACATFERVGLNVTCVPSESRDIAYGHLTDASDRLRAFRHWLYELFATALYRAKGWI